MEFRVGKVYLNRRGRLMRVVEKSDRTLTVVTINGGEAKWHSLDGKFGDNGDEDLVAEGAEPEPFKPATRTATVRVVGVEFCCPTCGGAIECDTGSHTHIEVPETLECFVCKSFVKVPKRAQQLLER